MEKNDYQQEINMEFHLRSRTLLLLEDLKKRC